MNTEVLPAWCRVVREPSQDLAAVFAARPVIAGPADAAAYFIPRLAAEEVEVFAVMMLDTRQRVIAMQEVTRGLVDSTMVHPREVFRLAILIGASSVIVAHNHPSDVLEPSPEDRHMTVSLVAAGEALGIPVRDHFIIGMRGHFSFAENGMI